MTTSIYVFPRKPFTRVASENIATSEERVQGNYHPRGHLGDCLKLVSTRLTGELSDPGGFMGSDIFLLNLVHVQNGRFNLEETAGFNLDVA